MKAIYKRNGRHMDINQAADGSWSATDQDGATFPISESTRKRWFKVIEEPVVKAAPVVETAEEPAPIIETPEPELVEKTQATEAQEAPTEKTEEIVVFLGDKLVSKPGAKTTQWQMSFGLPVGAILVIKDAASGKSTRGPVGAAIISGEGISCRARNVKTTLEQFFGHDVSDVLAKVKELRREYFKQLKGGK